MHGFRATSFDKIYDALIFLASNTVPTFGSTALDVFALIKYFANGFSFSVESFKYSNLMCVVLYLEDPR